MANLKSKFKSAVKSGPGDPVYGGTGANKPKSNKSAIIAGLIGGGVATIAAAIAKRKKKKESERKAMVEQDINQEVSEKDASMKNMYKENMNNSQKKPMRKNKRVRKQSSLKGLGNMSDALSKGAGKLGSMMKD